MIVCSLVSCSRSESGAWLNRHLTFIFVHDVFRAGNSTSMPCSASMSLTVMVAAGVGSSGRYFRKTTPLSIHKCAAGLEGDLLQTSMMFFRSKSGEVGRNAWSFS